MSDSLKLYRTIAELLDMNPTQQVIIGAMEAGAIAASDEDVLSAVGNCIEVIIY